MQLRQDKAGWMSLLGNEEVVPAPPTPSISGQVGQLTNTIELMSARAGISTIELLCTPTLAGVRFPQISQIYLHHQ
ncbi:MAG: hypothetical protein DI535_05040 [Citrobacter freundii]|nr:MAG: hypothetical protein DI535_05040 [Citrobacter freundii]